MIQKFIAIGRLGNDADLITTQAGYQLVTFNMAIDDGYFDKNSNQWVDKTVWLRVASTNKNIINKVANATGFLMKGDMVYVDGKITTYKDPNTNVDRYTVTAFTIKTFNKPNSRNNGTQQQNTTSNVTPPKTNPNVQQNPQMNQPTPTQSGFNPGMQQAPQAPQFQPPQAPTPNLNQPQVPQMPHSGSEDSSVPNLQPPV